MLARQRENKRFLVHLLGLVLVVGLIVSACGDTNNPTTPTINFLPLPPPVAGNYPANFQLLNVGGVQRQSVVSPFVDITYDNTGTDALDGTGRLQNEEITLKQLGKTGTTLNTQWGDYNGGVVQRTDYYAADGTTLLGGVVEFTVKTSIFQWLAGDFKYTVDKSHLYLVYVSPNPGSGQLPMLQKVVYNEIWKLGSEPLPWGLTAVWQDSASRVVPAQYDEYGFWEAVATPFELADTAISSVENNLNNSKLNPDIEMVHDASWGDLIGRHPGFSVFEHGSSVGTITTQFDNNWGRAPNTAPFSSGALSQVDWNVNGQYHGLLVLTPNLSPVPTSLYVFTSDPEVANVIRNTHGWTTLYRQLRAGMPGVDLAIYEIGDLAQITASGSGSHNGTPVTVSIKTGSGGGVSFSTFGHPTHLQVETAREDLARLGVPGLNALGMYYASTPASGSGLANYVACLSILTAPKETVLSQWGQDVSLLDMTGFPDVSMPTN